MLRRASAKRETRETQISVEVVLDGSGKSQVDTSIGMFDHLLDQLARHGLLDLSVQARGDTEVDEHHLVEDTGILLGRALREAIGDGIGIRRMGHAVVPLDEALARVALDLSGRGYAVIDAGLSSEERVGTLPADLVRHFLESFALEARITLHGRVEGGQSAHHKAEALFKAVARSLRDAVELDPRQSGEVPSTKGTING